MPRRPDYARKGFSRQPRGSGHAMSRRLLAAVSLTAAAALTVNAVPLLQHLPISNVEVRGVRYAELAEVVRLVQQQLQERRFGLLPQWLAPFFNLRRSEARLKREYPFASWSVNRQWWQGGLLVTVQERRAKVVWISGNGSFYLDDAGVAFAEVLSSKGRGVPTSGPLLLRHPAIEERLPVVFDERGVRVRLGQTALASRDVTFLLQLVSAIDSGDYQLGTVVTGYHWEAGGNRLAVETLRGFQVIFATDQPLGEQLGKLQAVLQQGVARREGLEYIDVRYGQKVFYK